MVVERLGLRDVGAPFTLADYVQLAGMGRRSVRLEVTQAGKHLGEVLIHHGEAWHARDRRGEGPRALSRLLDAPETSVSAHPYADTPTRTLAGSCEALLLDHLRRQDEGRPLDLGADLALDELTAATSPLPQPTRSAAPSALAGLSFDALYSLGVEALLDRRYPQAYEAFEAASRVGTSPSLRANLERLRTMGYGT